MLCYSNLAQCTGTEQGASPSVRSGTLAQSKVGCSCGELQQSKIKRRGRTRKEIPCGHGEERNMKG